MNALEFNNKYPLGTLVEYHKVRTRTRTLAQDLPILSKSFIYVIGFSCPVNINDLEVI